MKRSLLIHTVLFLGQYGWICAQSPTKTTLPVAGGARSQYHTISKSDRQRTLDDLLANYDPRIPPNYEEDFPVTVLVQLHITNIDSISESNMDYTIGMFLRQTWNDSRLAYKKIPKLRSLELDSRLMDNIWVPDLFIANEKDARFHLVTVPNKLMHIYPEGRVQYSLRISATLQCSMDLRKYPLDSQICYVMMESYGYSTEVLEFRWNPQPVSRDSRLQLAQFDFGDMRTYQCDKQYVALNYTCITLDFELRRSFGYYITQIYIPSILIVCLSWVSFWLDMDAVPARISLGLLTVLTMTTQSAGARSSLPKVSYVKGIDVWMATCLLFVFAALIEFAYVNVHSRVEKRRRQSCVGTHKIINGNDPDTEVDYEKRRQSRFRMFMPSREKARTCDRISRIAFPSVFFVFNVIYWCTYAIWKPENTTFS
ncbi:glycine receptor subunit alpha-3-like isoform X1 [Mercenaria mercenaria]|uniref:glycine receptor subunit alpha-3-like isoform X1 n=1 Tax=Mercenaria mercenaria TaxID=6596 RepID=UPI00234EC921|nr:glycine receptor subunit alpha-3-like isoform X1 [Mercenaria mercenaria]XP_045203266.2 glycine receptor subunit alpha-3-like isoform X1 [Mercenaria mercenaria]XP_045203267.2 glycine receptor subunit alpha-3-like isoform X1 [Mercenaria mercenaria]